MNKIKMYNILLILLYCFSISSCDDYSSPDINQGLDEENNVSLYMEQYDPIANVGQYTFPEMTVRPKKYWNLVEILNVGSRNELGWTSSMNDFRFRGLQYHLLGQSIAGLANRAVQEGRSEAGVWMYDHGSRESYNLSVEAMKNLGAGYVGDQRGYELANKTDYGVEDGVKMVLRDLFDGYILTDVENNPESGIVAAIASPIYNSIIVDIRDKEYYETEGNYTMTYDARNKTTADAWKEFKDKCNNKGLVVMPVQTGEMRDFAIMNGFFVLNINKQYGTSAGGQNLNIFEEILAWLEPGAPIFGWEQGIDEEVFVNRASKTGHVWVPSDWCYNLPLTSLLYKSRQSSILARVDNPQFIDFDKKKNYVSFFLSDGDNIQWMMNDFNSSYYSNPYANEMKMGFGMPIGNLAMLAPAQFSNLMNAQKTNYTLIESLGGGYLYVDNYGEESNRSARLKELAENVAASMRQHRVKVIGLMAKDLSSPAALEGFQAFVDANDQLEGIVAIQYSPYAGGKGEIYWVTNKNGEDIPVITAKYSLWNNGNYNAEREGTPAYIAGKLKAEASNESHSLISVHAWSKFSDIGTSTDELAENQDGNQDGAGAARLLMNHLGDNFEVVTVQELIWRVRMAHREEQTQDWLKRVF